MTPTCKSVGVYVPSCGRYDNIKTYNILNDCTYVVRKSEEEKYSAAGVKKLIAVDDEKINSLSKVRQWIIDNTEEDIVVQIDDDIEEFCYVNKNNFVSFKSKDDIDTEILRVAQIISDLNLGFASIQMTADVRTYRQEFIFKGLCGICCWFNKEALKGRYEEQIKYKPDQDFQLQELMNNRIVVIPSYFRAKAVYDKNAGGANSDKTKKRLMQDVEFLRRKWGRYFVYNEKKNVVKINVKR